MQILNLKNFYLKEHIKNNINHLLEPNLKI